MPVNQNPSMQNPSVSPATPVTPVPPVQPTDSVVGSNIQPNQRQELSIMSHLDSRTSQVLSHAQDETKKIKQALIEPEQILFGLLYDSDIFQLLSQFSVDASQLSQEIQSKEQTGAFDGQPTLSDNSQKVFDQAYSAVKGRGVEFISPEDLLMALFSQNIAASSLLQSKGIDKSKLEENLSKSSKYVSGKKSSLEQFGIDLTQQAKDGKLDPITGRDREVERMVHILLRRTKNNPIIIGEAGVGKTAIVEGLAQLIVSGKSAKDLASKKIIQLDVSSMVAGASHRGEFEERLRNVIKETQVAGDVILFIDEIHGLIGAGDSEGTLDASNIIKPFLARGQLQVIGTTTTIEYRRYFEKDKAFERRFQPVLCEEPDEDTAVEMLKVLVPKYEAFHKVTMTEDAIKASVKLSKRYIGERYLPDKAVDLLDEAAAQVRLELNEGKRQDSQIVQADIEKIVSSWTGIPITKLTEDESQKLLHLEDTIHKRLINQENAVALVAEAVRRGRIGLSSANRPIASFIFLGPTGVGKTELAKTLAEILFGKDDAMVRLDMSEYMEKHEVAKLIGAPPGYVGYEEGGQLTEAVRTKPYSIVLLDEVEKAHPDVFNILLQLLEDGRLTDNKGNTISFKNTIVIATSNIGSSLIQQQLIENAETDKGSKEPSDSKKKFEELNKILVVELRKFFRPELLNRFDGVVVFEPLTEKNMTEVARLGIGSTGKLLKMQGIDLDITEPAVARLAKEGYDPIYGARPLRRLIQSAIENPIAVLLINKTFIQGDKILIDYDVQKEEFKFTKVNPQPTQDSAVGSDQNKVSEQKPDPNQPSQSNGSQMVANGEKNTVQQEPIQPVTPLNPIISPPFNGSTGQAQVIPSQNNNVKSSTT
ncbi:ATP-dependent Clp protease ATP-binding subunit [Patescibacteria group bacterium]|nr:ATP-dependent Clp protease ATP-binding subunit [Patescibacteria group bacterium]